jgi:sugar phosphate isomerase/epimerase
MQAGFHSVGLHEAPILDAIAAVKAARYGAIELNAEELPWARPHVTPETSAELRASIRQACSMHGLAISAVGAHVEMVGADANRRRAAIDFVRGCIDLARDVGAPVVHILSGPVESGSRASDAWSWFAQAVAETADHAEAQGIVLAIEAIAGHLFHRIDDYRRLAADLPGTDIRVNFDPSHIFVQGEDPIRLVEEIGDRIAHAHMKDGSGRFPDFAFPPLGRGLIDFPALIGKLRQAGYDGTLSVEYEAQVFGFKESTHDILENGRRFLAGLGV